MVVQLVLAWVFCLLSIPRVGHGEAGPGAWALYIPAPFILGSFIIIY